MNKTVHVFVLLITIIFTQLVLMPPANGETQKKYEIIIAMCNPQVSQIKNIEQMFEKDIIPLRKIKLVAFYNENEAMDYAPSYTTPGILKTCILWKKNTWLLHFIASYLKRTAFLLNKWR